MEIPGEIWCLLFALFYQLIENIFWEKFNHPNSLILKDYKVLEIQGASRPSF